MASDGVSCHRQLGLELHHLGDHLPLFDGVTGEKISDTQDRKIEILRDALMDAARSRVEELGEENVTGQPSHPHPHPLSLSDPAVPPHMCFQVSFLSYHSDLSICN